MAEEYKSVHTGPVIDAGITRALPGGEIDQAINSKPNPNLLDNWYFWNPVNQRGQTEYTGSGYSIDRWYSIGTTVTVEDGDILLTNPQSYVSAWRQLFENPKRFAGKTVTLSVLVEEGNPYIQVMKCSAVNADVVQLANAQVPEGMHFVSVNIPSDAFDSTYAFLSVGISVPAGTSVKIKAVKLELGSEQTLAHQENGVWVLNEIPNYAEELAKCQRYQLKLIYGTSQNYAPIGFGFANNTTSIRILIPTPATMRAAPTLSYLSGSISGLTILCDGKQLIPESVNTVNVLPYGVALMFTVSDATSSAPCVLRATSAYCILDANL